MTGTNQQSEQEQRRAATAIMIRAIILAAIVALVVSAAPASAVTSKAKAPRFEAERATAFVWMAELSPVMTRKPKPPGLSIGSAEVFELNTAKGRSAGKVAKAAGKVTNRDSAGHS